MYDKLKGKENISKSTLSGSASINCFWRDFSLNAYVNTGMTTLSCISWSLILGSMAFRSHGIMAAGVWKPERQTFS